MSSHESQPDADAISGIASWPIGLWAASLAVLVSLPSLFVGFSNDDLSHRLILEGQVPGYTSNWFGLYDFTPPGMPASALIKQGLLPWFTDPDLALRFFRPLSSATLALDSLMFGRNSLLAHLHSLLWMAVFAGTAGRLYLRWFSAPVALVSVVVFAISGVHAIPLSWLASRHTLVAATFGALSFWAWVRFREDHFKPGLVWLSLPSQFAKASETQKRIALTADVGSCSKNGSLYLVNGSDPILTLYAAAALRFYSPEKAGAERLRVLSMAPQSQRLSRTASSVLELEVLGAPRESNPFEKLFRAPSHPLRAGQRFDLGELAVQVDATSAGLFTRARFEFENDIESSQSCLMVWKDGRLESIPVPHLGESVRVEHEPGPMGL